MKQNNSGFSLVEIVAAIAILGILVGPVCTSLIFGLRLNEKTDADLQAQLAVSSAVETLMAEGISTNSEVYELVQKELNGAAIENVFEIKFNEEAFDAPVTVEAEKQTVTKDPEAGQTEATEIPLPYFKVIVTSDSAPDIKVETYIREAVTTQ